MSGSGTKFLASTLLTLNLLPGSLGAQPLHLSSSAVPNTRQTTSASRFAGDTQQETSVQGDQEPKTADSQLELEARRKKVNEALITLAQEDFARVSKLAEDNY